MISNTGGTFWSVHISEVIYMVYFGNLSPFDIVSFDDAMGEMGSLDNVMGN